MPNQTRQGTASVAVALANREGGPETALHGADFLRFLCPVAASFRHFPNRDGEWRTGSMDVILPVRDLPVSGKHPMQLLNVETKRRSVIRFPLANAGDGSEGEK